MNSYQRKRQRREQRKTAAAMKRTIASDALFGVRVERLRPSGGRDRLRVVWDPDPDPWVALVALDRLHRSVLRDLEQSLVFELRLDGFSWDEIADAWNQTGQAFRRRHPDVDAQVAKVIADAG